MSVRVLTWLMIIGVLELLSIATIFNPSVNGLVALVIACIVFCVTIWRPEYGLAAMGAELIIGSKGSLLKWGGNAVNDGGISLRVLLFVAVMSGWGVNVLLTRAWRSWKSSVWRDRMPYVCLTFFIIYGTIRGMAFGHQALMQDANAWAFWLMLLPAIDLSHRGGKRLADSLIAAVIAGLVWLCWETIVLFVLFTHGWMAVGDPVYLWLRRTGVGEVTRLFADRSAHRIFFQSHLYAALAVIVGTIHLWLQKERRVAEGFLLLLVMLATFISLSRSLWIGVFVAIVVAVVLLLTRGRSISWRQGMRPLVIAASALLLIEGILLLPTPYGGQVHLVDFIVARVSQQEAAAISRWQLLPLLWEKIMQAPMLGHGFGATVTYATQDPRAIERSGGWLATYAFEWGWLDVWIKLGIGGPILLVIILGSLIRRWWNAGGVPQLRISMIAILVGLAVIHVFTPYLNHTLGIGFVIAAEALLAYARPYSSTHV
jgi:hypothetical protein